MDPSASSPPPASPKKRTAAILWALGLVTLGCCFLGAIAGPKFASFNRRASVRSLGGEEAPAVARPREKKTIADFSPAADAGAEPDAGR